MTTTEALPRFTAAARKRSGGNYYETALNLEAIVKKKQEKKVELDKRERTVAHLLAEISAKCSNQEKLKVSRHWVENFIALSIP